MLAPFASLEQRVNTRVQARLANAIATWQGGEPFGVFLDTDPVESFDGVVTGPRHTVSMCVANAPGIAEGSTALVLKGHACRVTGAVVPDASGWATFPIVFEERP